VERHAEQLGQLARRLGARLVQLDEVSLLAWRELGLAPAQLACRARNRHAFSCAHSDEV
jgi:hypothetical protein